VDIVEDLRIGIALWAPTGIAHIQLVRNQSILSTLRGLRDRKEQYSGKRWRSHDANKLTGPNRPTQYTRHRHPPHSGYSYATNTQTRLAEPLNYERYDRALTSLLAREQADLFCGKFVGGMI